MKNLNDFIGESNSVLTVLRQQQDEVVLDNNVLQLIKNRNSGSAPIAPQLSGSRTPL